MPAETLEFWIDLNLPPVLAVWLREDYNVAAKSFMELDLQSASDQTVFKLAKKKSIEAKTIVITTKDYDFVCLSEEIGSPPKILYLNIGNVSNIELRQIIAKSFRDVVKIFTKTNQNLVEITNKL